uniref:THUMP domain-containing protein n=1 Tax=Pavo cristatus TaxID=9049 RepID=A0A8C9F4B1_PAVCR
MAEAGMAGPEAAGDGAAEERAAVIGATVPTGFEVTAAAEVQEKLGSASRISRDRGKIYFEVPARSLPEVHRLRSVDNLFVVVQEFKDYQFKETKEDALKDLEDLVKKLPWSDPLKIWELNNSLKKKKTKRKKHNLQRTASKEKLNEGGEEAKDHTAEGGQEDCAPNTAGVEPAVGQSAEEMQGEASQNEEDDNEQSEAKNELHASSGAETTAGDDKKDEGDDKKDEGDAKVLKFRVTCNRAGDKHSFTSNEAARDFGGAVQEHFQWKADMTNFDVEVLPCALEIILFQKLILSFDSQRAPK